jgi:hypothetical protein
MSLRKEIRRLIYELLKGSTLAGDNVYSNRVSRSKADKFPQINIYALTETIRDMDESPRRYTRTLSVICEALSCKSNGGESADEIDDMCEEIEQLFLAEDADKNRELGSMCESIELVNTEIESDERGEGAISAARIMVSLTYTDLGYVGKLAGINDGATFQSGWDIHPDEGVEAQDTLTFEE